MVNSLNTQTYRYLVARLLILCNLRQIEDILTYKIGHDIHMDIKWIQKQSKNAL